MSQLPVDYAYTNLLTHLQHPRPGLTLQTTLSAIQHYLSQLPLPHPTQLAAFVIASPLWKPPSVDNARLLTTSFRSAVHFKYSNLQKEKDSWFSRSRETRFREWISAVLKGVSRGDAQLRIAILGGIVLGLEDLRNEDLRGDGRERVEEQVIIACAEGLEGVLTTNNAWNREFTERGSELDEDANGTLFLFSACQVLPLVTSDKLGALDVHALGRVAQRGVAAAFASGGFLSDLPLSCARQPNGQITISSNSRLASSIEAVSKHPLYDAAGPLAKLLSRCLAHLAEVTPFSAWHTFYDASRDLEVMASTVETGWQASLLAEITSEEDIESQTRELTTEVWKILKTLLFAHLLVSQSILSSISFLPPPPDSTPSEFSPSSISRSILRSLHHLSFVLSQFGGVTSTGEGFKELKRVFYMALDIIAADLDPSTCDHFVRELVSGAREPQVSSENPFHQSRTAYVLALIEQLVPLLSESVIENVVIPFCHPYLNNPLKRETYESAHSVILSVFAAHAQNNQEKIATDGPTLVRRLVPFYADSLIKNSTEGRLSTAQLRLAYSSLVRSAASSRDDALTWLCVEALLSRMEASAVTSPSSRTMDLYLTLVSLISCVPLSLLPRELEEVQKVLETVAHSEEKTKLADAVLEEITSKVGDREREFALSWWCGLAPRLSGSTQQQE